MIDNKGSEHLIFDGRYSVLIGLRGKVSIKSNRAQGKLMRLYGKVKDSLRYVNLTTLKGGFPDSYRVSDLVDVALGVIASINPLTEEEIHAITEQIKPPVLLSTLDSIESLPTELDNYNNTVYVEELDNYTRYYKKIKFTNSNNGFMKFMYKVSTKCTDTKNLTNSNTVVFTDFSTILITDIDTLDITQRTQIIGLLQKGLSNAK